MAALGAKLVNIGSFYLRIRGRVLLGGGTLTGYHLSSDKNQTKIVNTLCKAVNPCGADVKNTKPGSLLVELQCNSPENFLKFLDAYESDDLLKRLSEEFYKIGIDQVTVEIENKEEVLSRREAIRRKMSQKQLKSSEKEAPMVTMESSMEIERCIMTSELFAVENGGSFYKRSPPGDADDNWISSAHKIGTKGWESFKFLFFGPDDDLFAVQQSGSLLKGRPPIDAQAADWIDQAKEIGTKGWQRFKFLFFGPDGDLYAVRENGSFLKGPPPEKAQDTWIARATKIGTAGWADFKFLFFGPDAHLYAVKEDGSFLKSNPPTHPDDNWSAGATKIGTAGWADFKFLFFCPNPNPNPDAHLYAVKKDGSFLKSHPPTPADDNWTACASKIGAAGWADFKFLF